MPRKRHAFPLYRLIVFLSLALCFCLATGAAAGVKLLEGQVETALAYSSGQNVSFQGDTEAQFLDWLDDILDWFDDKKDEVTNDYNEDGIPNSAFSWANYGMNVHQVDTMTVEDFERVLSYAGPWVRVSVSTDEVAEGNWSYRLEPALDKIRQAGTNLNLDPQVVINLTGYSNYGSGEEYLLRDLSWADKGNRYYNLAYSLTNKVQELGFEDAIIEAWNEPDHDAYDMGIGLSTDDPEFVSALSTLLNGFSAGVHAAGGTSAFSPFMTIGESKYDVMKTVWESTHSGFDYFSGHIYDDDPGKTRYWAERVADMTADRPVIITEHGYQAHLKDYDYYRRQAWALYQGFNHNGQTTLKGVMGYVYGSNHQPWVIDPNDDFLWLVTHDSKPENP